MTSINGVNNNINNKKSKENKIFKLIQSNNIKKLKSYISSNNNNNKIKDLKKNGLDILLYSIECTNTSNEIIKYIISKKIFENLNYSVCTLNNGIKTPLFQAFVHNRLNIVEYLLNNNANINYLNGGLFDYLYQHKKLNKQNFDLMLQYIILSCQYKTLNYSIHIEKWGIKTPLFSAVAFNRFKLVKLLIRNGAKINNQENDIIDYFFMESNKAFINIDENDENNESPLVLAIKNGNEKILDCLLNYGANLSSVKNSDSNSNKCELTYIINIAIKNNNYNMVKYLMKTDKYRKLITTGDYDKNKEIPIILAIRNENFDILNCLLQSNSSSYYSNRYTKTDVIYALVMAINNNKMSIIKSLIENKNYGFTIKIDEKYHDNSESAISAAIKNENRTIMDYLLNYGANLNQNSYYSYYYGNYKCNLIDILSIAINCNKLSMIKYLLENDGYNKYIDVNSRNKNDKYPISLAINNKSIEIIEYLLNHGISNTNSNNYYSSYINYNKETLIYVLNKAIKNEKLLIVKYLINNCRYNGSKIDINDTDDNNEYPILEAIRKCNVVIMHYLLENGNDRNASYNGNRSSYDHKTKNNVIKLINKAINYNSYTVVKYIIETNSTSFGIDETVDNNENSDTNNESPLVLAIKNGNEKILDCLLNYGANLSSVKNSDSNSNKCELTYIINIAIKNNNYNTVKYLMKTDKYRKLITPGNYDKNKEIPIILAIRNENFDILNCLLQSNSSSYYSNRYNKTDVIYALVMAINNNKISIVKSLIENKNYGFTIKIDEKYHDNSESAISAAIKNENRTIMDYLLNYGANLNQNSYYSYYYGNYKCNLIDILSIAINCNKLSMIKYLLENDGYNKYIDVNSRNKNDKYPISLAINNKSIEIIEYLLNHGISNTNSNNYYSSYINYNKETLIYVLNKAIKNEKLLIVKYLINNCRYNGSKIDINDTDDNNEYPILEAIRKCNVVIMHYLLENGNDRNASYNGNRSSYDHKTKNNVIKLINKAINYNSYTVVKYIIETNSTSFGIDETVDNNENSDTNNESPLVLAIKNGNEK
ncbi:ankyrin, partial [Neocallimastix lanati (nom. inval.)]